ncbi:MAG TPA: hypothetical protein VK845_15180 [Gemmatimonadales bacterium]|nr:hypothetical protein [Gemmatimonadales bacterium]
MPKRVEAGHAGEGPNPLGNDLRLANEPERLSIESLDDDRTVLGEVNDVSPGIRHGGDAGPEADHSTRGERESRDEQLEVARHGLEQDHVGVGNAVREPVGEFGGVGRG